jgi:nucleoside-diphosphate kinase
MVQQAVVFVKPDGIQRGLVGEIVSRFERKGLKLIGMKMMVLTDDVLDSWYEHHKGKPFFGGLKHFMTSSPVVAMLWEGVDCIQSMRILCGTTNARTADAGSIRGDLSMGYQMNLIHASDSEEAAAKERSLVFADNEIFDYDKDLEVHIYTEEDRPSKKK